MIQIASINETGTSSKMRVVKRCSEQLRDLWNHHFGVQEWWMQPIKFSNMYTSKCNLYGPFHFQIYPFKCSYQNPGSQPNTRPAENSNLDKGSGAGAQLKCKKSVLRKYIWQDEVRAWSAKTQIPAQKLVWEGKCIIATKCHFWPFSK